MIPQVVLTLLRLALSMLFLFSGVAKLFDLRGFNVIVAKFGILPRKYVKPFAYSLPFVEIIIGAWLLSDLFLVGSAAAAALLLIVSEVGILNALLKKKKIENCGCFGPGIKVPVNWRKFIENLIWLAMALELFVTAL